MLLYSKNGFGLPLAFSFNRGSPLTRCCLLPVLSVVLTALLWQFTCRHVPAVLSAAAGDDAADGEEDGEYGQCVVKWFFHPFPFQLYTTFLGFIIVFRVNMSIGRYWEGRTFMETVRIRWGDACMQLVHFDEAASRGDATFSPAAVAWRARVLHLFSLMHAVAVQYLRDDLELSNLIPLGAADTVAAHGAAVAPAGAARAFTACSRASADQIPSSALGVETGNAAPAPVVQPAAPLLRTAVPWSSSLVHQFGPSSHRRLAAAAPLAVIGGLSEAERAALAATHARVRLVQSWVLRAMADRLGDEGLTIGTRHPPTPILTRVYQLMSEATHAFAQSRKIVETPFPFPHAHLISLSLLFFCLLTPLVMVAWTAELWVALLLDGVSTFAFVAMNEVATDLEDPFVGAPNNLALATMHAHYNDDLLSYGHEYAAAAGSPGSAVGTLPIAAQRAAAAAQRAQGGGGSKAVEVAGSPYTAFRSYLVRCDQSRIDEEQRTAVSDSLPPIPPTMLVDVGVRRTRSEMSPPPRGRGASLGPTARAPLPAAVAHAATLVDEKHHLHFQA